METTAIQTINQPTTQVVDTTDYKNKCIEYLTSMGNKLPTKQQTQFLELASAYKLNPFKREIYAVGYGENWNIITGYEVYIKRAERTGKLNGWKVTVTGKGEEMTATVTIHRKDWENPFEHTVLFSEVCQKTKDGRLNSVWGKMPSFMCKKVAIAQGFRLCFSDELAGMPYTSDELPEPETRDITPKEKPLVIQAVEVQEEKTAPAPKKSNTKKYTEAQGKELASLMAAKDLDDCPIFSEDAKKHFRQLLIDGQFEQAKQEAQSIIDLAVPKAAEPSPSDIEGELEDQVSLF